MSRLARAYGGPSPCEVGLRIAWVARTRVGARANAARVPERLCRLRTLRGMLIQRLTSPTRTARCWISSRQPSTRATCSMAAFPSRCPTFSRRASLRYARESAPARIHASYADIPTDSLCACGSAAIHVVRQGRQRQEPAADLRGGDVEGVLHVRRGARHALGRYVGAHTNAIVLAAPQPPAVVEEAAAVRGHESSWRCFVRMCNVSSGLLQGQAGAQAREQEVQGRSRRQRLGGERGGR